MTAAARKNAAIVALFPLTLAGLALGAIRTDENLAKVGNSHAIYDPNGGVRLLDGGNMVVSGIRITGAAMTLRKEAVGLDSRTVTWTGKDGSGQKLTVDTAGATLAWEPGGRAISPSIFVPEHAFAGTEAWHYSLTDRSGRTARERLSSDWNFPEPTKTDIAEMQIDTPAASFTFVCDGPGWQFVDRRPSREHRGLFEFRTVVSAPVSFTVRYGAGKPAHFAAVDLSAGCNMALRDEVAGDQKGGWDDEGVKDLRRLPTGLEHYAGVPFDIVDDAGGMKNACVMLQGKERPYFPAEASVRLSGSAKMLYFLNALTWGGYMTVPPFERGEYVVRYADGAEAAMQLMNGRNIGDWWEPKVLPAAVPGWLDPQHTAAASEVGLYVTFWENPFPEKELEQITFRSNGISIVGVVAMTLADRVIHPKRFELERRDTFPLPTLSVGLADGPAQQGKMMLTQHLRAAKVDLVIHDFATLADTTDLALVCGRLDSGQCAALRRYVRAGGAVLFVTESPPQGELADLLPILPGERSRIDCRDETTFLVPADPTHPLFSGIPWSRPKDSYPISPTYDYYAVTARDRADVLATWNGAAPALIHWQVGNGRVLLWTSPRTVPGGRQGYRSSHIDYLHAKLVFWLAGFSEQANRFGTLAQAKDARQDLLDPLVALRVRHEGQKATAAYLGKEELIARVAALNDELRGLNKRLEQADDAMVVFEPEKALGGYGEIGALVTALEKRAQRLEEDLAAHVRTAPQLARVTVRTGQALRIGQTHLDYRHPPFGPHSVETWNLRRAIANIKRMGWDHFDTVPNFLWPEPVLLKPGADPEEPSSDHFDFSELYDPLVTVCRETGVKAVSHRSAWTWTAPSTGVGDYLYRGTPRMTRADGSTPERGGSDFNVFSDETRSRMAAAVEAHAAYVEKHKDVFIGAQVDNETGIYDVCYGGETTRKWHQWLARRFESVDAMNQALRTNCADFEDLPAVAHGVARKYGESSADHARWYEFHRFLIERHGQFFQANHDAHRRHSTVPLIDRSGAYGTQGCRVMAMLGRTHDFIGSHQDKIVHLDLTVGATEKPVWLNEYYHGYWAGPWAGLHYRLFGSWILPEVDVQHRNFAAFGRNLWRALSRGVEAISVYTAFAGGGKHEFDQGWFGPSRAGWHDLTPNYDALALKYMPREYNRISGELAGAKAQGTVCIVEPLASVMQSDSLTSSRGGLVITEIEAIHRLCFADDFQCDALSQTRDFSAYPVVVLPLAYYLENGLARRLVTHTRRGGTLICTGAPNVYDEHSWPSMLLLRDLAGVRGAERCDSGGRLATATEAGLRAPPGEDACWRFAFEEGGKAEVLGAYAEGSVGAFTARAGAGRLVVVGFGAAQAPTTFWQLVLPHVAAAAPRPVRSSNPRVELFQRTRGEDRFVFAMNQDHERPQAAELTWRPERPVVDLRACLLLTPRERLGLNLEPGECRVLKITGPLEP